MPYLMLKPVSNHQEYKVKFYNLYGAEALWTHNAVEAEKYLSIHTINHFNSPEIGEFNEDDLPYKMREIWKTAVKPMVYDEMAFGDKNEELNDYHYDLVEVPVTKEQFELANSIIENQIEKGRAGKDKYSIFSFFGTSCARTPQLVLKAITQNTTESSLAEPSWLHEFVAWPQATYNRAANVAKARESSKLKTTCNTRLFSSNQPLSNDVSELPMQRLSLF